MTANTAGTREMIGISEGHTELRRRHETRQGLPVNPSATMITNRLSAILYGSSRKWARKMGLGESARHYRGALTGRTSAAVKERRCEDIDQTAQLFAGTQFEDTAREICRVAHWRSARRLSDEDIQRLIDLAVDLRTAIVQSERG